MSTPTKNANALAYIVAASGAISLTLNGKHHSIPADFPNYVQVKKAINAKDVRKLEKLVNASYAISKATKGVCKIENGQVTYNGKPLANVITERILRLMREGFRFDPMLRFLENVMANPSLKAIDELYLFLEAGEIPITDDGCFLAYKRVSKEYRSIHRSPDGTYEDHSIGKKPKMKREDVDPNRDRTCSRGLHFCSLSYLPSYGSDAGGDKTVILKINPADVVSIPSDYSNTKGRAWTYEVIAEHTKGQTTHAFDQPVYKASTAYGVKPSGQKFYAERGSNGKFVKRS